MTFDNYIQLVREHAACQKRLAEIECEIRNSKVCIGHTLNLRLIAEDVGCAISELTYSDGDYDWEDKWITLCPAVEYRNKVVAQYQCDNWFLVHRGKRENIGNRNP